MASTHLVIVIVMMMLLLLLVFSFFAHNSCESAGRPDKEDKDFRTVGKVHTTPIETKAPLFPSRIT